MTNIQNDFIPFHKPYYDDSEIEEVVDTIKSGWWTMGPKTKKFEEEFKNYIGCKHAVAVSSWTAGAHLILEAIGIKPGDEVIVPAMTFTATAEVVCYMGAKPVITDIDPETLNISVGAIKKNITSKTRAIIPVHYGGLPCDMDLIKKIAHENNLFILEDAAHALPAFYNGEKVGTLSDAACFSFYVTKTLAAGEGGMICTNDDKIAERCKIMRLHGISTDVWNRNNRGNDWYYEVIAPGFKYNFTDIQAALGLCQLKKIDLLHEKRKQIAKKYNDGFKDNCLVKTPVVPGNMESSYHLYTIRIDFESLKINRDSFINELKKMGIGVSVHFIPLYRHPYYRDNFSLNPSEFINSENIFKEIISLPIWPGMTAEQTCKVVDCVNRLIKLHKNDGLCILK